MYKQRARKHKRPKAILFGQRLFLGSSQVEANSKSFLSLNLRVSFSNLEEHTYQFKYATPDCPFEMASTSNSGPQSVRGWWGCVGGCLAEDVRVEAYDSDTNKLVFSERGCIID